MKDPRTFLLVCVRDRESERAVTRPAVPPFLKSDFFRYLLCNIHLNLEEKFSLIFFVLSHPLHPPNLARCSLLATVHNSFLVGCCQSYKHFARHTKGLLELILNILEYSESSCCLIQLDLVCLSKAACIFLSELKTCGLLLQRDCTLFPAS